MTPGLALLRRRGTAAEFPAVLEEAEEVVIAEGVLGHLGFIEFDADARLVRRLDVAVDHPWHSIHDVEGPLRVKVVEAFLDQEIRQAGVDMSIDGGIERTLRLMQGDRGLSGLGDD